MMNKLKRQEQKLEDNGYDLEDLDVLLIDDDCYCDSLVGLTDDNRAVYDEDMMVEEFAEYNKCSHEEALEFIEYNVLRALPYYYEKAPIIFRRLE